MPQSARTCVVLVFISLLALCLLPPSTALVLRAPNGTVTYLTSPYFYFGNTTFDVTAALILPPHTASQSACHKLPPLPHAIVYVDPLGCSIETKIRHCQAAGSVGVISASSADVAGNEVWTQWDGTDKKLMHIPFLHVGRDDGETLRAALLQWTIATNGTDSTNVTSWMASLSSEEASVNVWAAAYDSVYFLTLFQTLLGLFNLFLILLASRKLIQYHHRTASSAPSATSTSPSSSSLVPYLCLSLLLFSSVIVAVYCLVDPFGAKHVLPYVYCRVLLFLCLPLCFASLLLLLLFISDALLSSRRSVESSPSPQSSSSSPIVLSSSPVLTRAFTFARALSFPASSPLQSSWLQRKLSREGKSRLLSPISTLLFFVSFAFLILFDLSMSITDSLIFSDVVNAVTQLTYAGIALAVLVAVITVGLRAAARMWAEEERRKERVQRRQDEAAELQREREEARKRPLVEDDDEELDRVGDVTGADLLGLPDTSMRMSFAYKHHTPTASPSLLSLTAFQIASSPHLLPDLPLLRIDSFPSSSAASYQLVHLHHPHGAVLLPATTSCDEDVATPPPLQSSPSFSSTTSLLTGRSGLQCVSVWSVVEGWYAVPRLYRLMRFVVLASIGLVGLIVLLCWRPLDSPLTFIGRQGALYVCVGWLSASMISVF